MRFSEIIGNDSLKKTLAAMADSGRVAHAVLMYENEGCGALPLALSYVQYLNCTNRKDGDSCGECPSCRQMSKLVHPDVHFVFPVNKGSKTSDKVPTSESYIKEWRELVSENPYFIETDLQRALGIESKNGLIAVAEAKSIISKLSLSSVQNGYKTVILYLPEKMNQETANRLLKLIEEPPVDTLFLFITHAPEKVLQTIFSRCQSLRVLPLSKEEKAEVKEVFPAKPSEDEELFKDLFADTMHAVMSGNLSAALECGEEMAGLDSRERQKAFCQYASECIRKIFLYQQRLQQIADVQPHEVEFYEEMATKCPKGFCVKTNANIEKVVSMIDRNVNSKILFCDLVNRMIMNI